MPCLISKRAVEEGRSVLSTRFECVFSQLVDSVESEVRRVSEWLAQQSPPSPLRVSSVLLKGCVVLYSHSITVLLDDLVQLNDSIVLCRKDKKKLDKECHVQYDCKFQEGGRAS